MSQELDNLEQLLDHIEDAAREEEQVSLGKVVETLGNRSFGPLLLMVGVVIASPISGIPGVPTAMALVVMLIALQLLFGGKEYWLPNWLLQRSVAHRRVTSAFKWIRPPARVVDRLTRPRFGFIVHRFGTYAIAIICVLISLGMPAMEIVPFSATGAGFALAAFGLALVSRDGLLALIAFAITALTGGLVLRQLL